MDKETVSVAQVTRLPFTIKYLIKLIAFAAVCALARNLLLNLHLNGKKQWLSSRWDDFLSAGMIRCDLVLLKCLICVRNDHCASHVPLWLIVWFLRRKRLCLCQVMEVTSAEEQKKKEKRRERFSFKWTWRDFFFFLWVLPGRWSGTLISSAELVVIVGNQPLKLFWFMAAVLLVLVSLRPLSPTLKW